MIAGGACCTSAGGQKGLEAFGTGRSAGTGGCAHETGDGTNVGVQPPPQVVGCDEWLDDRFNKYSSQDIFCWSLSIGILSYQQCIDIFC